MITAAHSGDARGILIGILGSKIAQGLITTEQALGRAYDAGFAAGEEPPTVRARTLKELIDTAKKAARQ